MPLRLPFREVQRVGHRGQYRGELDVVGQRGNPSAERTRRACARWRRSWASVMAKADPSGIRIQRAAGEATRAAREVEAVGLVQAIDVLDLVRVESRHHVVPRPPRLRPEGLGRTGPSSGGRLIHVDHQPADPVVRVRAGAVHPTSDRLGDPLVYRRQVLAGHRVEMIEALRHRPGAGRRLPGELLVAERCNQCIGVSGDLFELLAEFVDSLVRAPKSPLATMERRS